MASYAEEERKIVDFFRNFSFLRSLCRRCAIAVTPSCPWWTPSSTAVNFNSAHLHHRPWLDRRNFLLGPNTISHFWPISIIFTLDKRGYADSSVYEICEGWRYAMVLYGMVWYGMQWYAMVLYGSGSLARLLSLQVWSVPKGNICLLLSWESPDYTSHTPHFLTHFQSWDPASKLKVERSKLNDTSKADVAPWCYKWIGTDGSPV